MKTTNIDLVKNVKLEDINVILNLHCERKPIFDPGDFVWTKNFRDNWEDIYLEYKNFNKDNSIPTHHDIQPLTCDNLLVGKESWKTLFLKVYTKDVKNSEYFPKTMKYINSCDCSTAFFSILEPYSIIKPHTGLYKGVMRYHIGLKVPKDSENCYIALQNDNGVYNKLNWKEGDDIMFDDMFPHFVVNNTPDTRVVLFLDIVRDFKNLNINNLNKCVLAISGTNDIVENTVMNSNNFNHGANKTESIRKKLNVQDHIDIKNMNIKNIPINK